MAATKPSKRGRKPGVVNQRQSPTCSLTQAIIDEFTRIVKRGNFRQVARQRLGISVATYDRWISAGKKQIREVEQGKRKQILLQGKFVIAMDAAEGFVHGKMVEDILESGSIQARQWYLERRFNKMYSRSPAAHTDDETGKDIKIDAGELLLDKLKTVLGHDE